MWHVADDVLDWVSYYFSFELKNKQNKKTNLLELLLLLF